MGSSPLNASSDAEAVPHHRGHEAAAPAITTAYLRLVRITLLLSALLPSIVLVCSRTLLKAEMTAGFVVKVSALTLFMVLVGAGSWRLIGRLTPFVDTLARQQTRYLDELPHALIPLAIAASAAASLMLELAVIRWHGTVWEIFAFYKNFSLLSCFAGLGLGYALARRERIPAIMILPLLSVQMLLLVALRYGMGSRRIVSLLATPITEQLNMGLATASGHARSIPVFCFLTTVMLSTATAFIPVGQLCGRLLERATSLRAYGLNLFGSLVGVVLIMVLGFLWTPPVLWFLPCFGVFLLLQSFSRQAVTAGLLFSFVAIAVLSWPVSFGFERIYSPYQLLERGVGYHGLMKIRAAGHYFQRVDDLSTDALPAYAGRAEIARYYEMPYRMHPHPHRVAVVGAGAGNDVAAGLRMGADHIDAIEIDPAIIALGEKYHPERPYDDDRVSRIVDDARTFLRSTTQRYDLILYGLLDSHTLLSHASSVRLDSFVYTVEGIRDARSRLADHGMVSLSFCVLSEEIGRKIFIMMQEAFDGHPPVCIRAGYDGSVIFAQTKEGDLQLAPALLEGSNFTDVSRVYADPALRADVSTDDWPFFYMPQRIYPTSYVWMVLLVLAVSLCLFGSFRVERVRSSAAFFFMGAGFMLVETKAITELGLMFGNTWQVVGVVLAAILLMAFLANLAVMQTGVRHPTAPFCLLLCSLAIGLVVAKSGGFPATPFGRMLAVTVLTSPMFFSGIAFSALLAGRQDISGALAMNLLGAMCGGLLEYNSMYFGFQFLYWIAIGLYGAALLGCRLRPASSVWGGVVGVVRREA